MDEQIFTSVNARVDSSREGELVDGFRALTGDALPDGLVRTELLRGQDGMWRIQSLWRDRAALLATRETGERPAALVLFERVGAEHAHEIFTVVASTDGLTPGNHPRSSRLGRRGDHRPPASPSLR